MTALPVDRAHWAGLLHRLARFRSGHHDEEDLLHSAYVRLETYRANHAVEDPNAFLMRTALNVAIDSHRQEKFWESNSTPGTLADNSPLQDEAIAARARLARVQEGLSKLPPRTREILLMHRLEGRRYKEIAAHFGISRSAVEKHIARAMVFLTDWTQGW